MAIGTPTSIGIASNTVTATTVVLTTTGAVTAGDSIVCAITVPLASATLSSVADSAGNTYAVDIDKAHSSQARHVWIASCHNALALAAGGTITATFTGSLTQAKTIVATTVSGLATTSTLDKTGTNEGTGTAWTSGTTGTLGQADELLFVVTMSGRTSTPTGGWTEVADQNDADSVGYQVQYKIVSATTAVDEGGTLSSSGNWASAVATYKGAGAAPTVITASSAEATAAGADVVVSFAATVSVTTADATASGDDVTISIGSTPVTITVDAGEATASGDDVVPTFAATITVTAGEATASGDPVGIGDGTVTVTCVAADATATGDTVTPVYATTITVLPGAATATGQATPTIIGPPVGGGSGEGTDRPNEPGLFRIKLTSLHHPENQIAGTAARPAQALATITQFTDAEVDIPANDARTARVTISMHDPAYELVEEYETLIHVTYVTANTSWLVFWGVVSHVSDSSESETVTLSCVDRSLSLTRHFIRYGDQVLNESYDPLPNIHGKGFVSLDSYGLSLLRDCGVNTTEQTLRGMPDLGIADGTDTTTPLPFLTLDKIEVKRGQQIWQTMLDVVKHDIAPDFELEPIDTVTGVYAQINFYDRQGDSDPDNLLLHDGFGKDNCRIDRTGGGQLTTHAHVLSTGDQKRVTVADAVSSEARGAYVDWDSTEYAASDTTPLYDRGSEIVRRGGVPLQYFDVRLNDSCGLYYMEDFTVGAACRAVRRRGVRVFSEEGHITRVTLRQRDTAGNVTPVVECAVVSGTGVDGDDNNGDT